MTVTGGLEVTATKNVVCVCVCVCLLDDEQMDHSKYFHQTEDININILCVCDFYGASKKCLSTSEEEKRKVE